MRRLGLIVTALVGLGIGIGACGSQDATTGAGSGRVTGQDPTLPAPGTPATPGAPAAPGASGTPATPATPGTPGDDASGGGGVMTDDGGATGSTCSNDGAPCTASSPCKLASISCATGAPLCIDSSNAADGTSCGAGMVCNAGACVPCTSNASCTPADPCHLGTTTCTAGAPACVDTGLELPAGTPCGTTGGGRACSATGACVCPAGMHDCGGKCVDYLSPDACGASCTPCPSPAGGTASCENAKCSFACGGVECHISANPHNDDVSADGCVNGQCSCGAGPKCSGHDICQGGTCVCSADLCARSGGCCLPDQTCQVPCATPR